MNKYKALDRFARHNLHWISREKYQAEDPHLSKLAQLKRRVTFKFVNQFPLEIPGIYGGQLGKSTCLKQVML